MFERQYWRHHENILARSAIPQVVDSVLRMHDYRNVLTGLRKGQGCGGQCTVAIA
jgi:hypothetical protein